MSQSNIKKGANRNSDKSHKRTRSKSSANRRRRSSDLSMIASLHPPRLTLDGIPAELRMQIFKEVLPQRIKKVLVCSKRYNKRALVSHKRKNGNWADRQTFHLGGSTLNRVIRQLRIEHGTTIPYVCKTFKADFQAMHKKVSLRFCSRKHARHAWEALNGKNVRSSTPRIPHARYLFANSNKESTVKWIRLKIKAKWYKKPLIRSNRKTAFELNGGVKPKYNCTGIEDGSGNEDEAWEKEHPGVRWVDYMGPPEEVYWPFK